MEHEIYPSSYEENAESIMSNFDHQIDKEVVEILKKEKKWASYPGWNFYGSVWWNRKKKKWACVVEQLRCHVDTLYALTPAELMEKVSSKYGWS